METLFSLFAIRNAPFAAGIEDELQYRRDAQVTAIVLHLLKGIGAKKEKKKQKKQKKRKITTVRSTTPFMH